MDHATVLAAHDLQVRRDLIAPPGYVVEDLGAVVRRAAPIGRGGPRIEWSAVDGTTVDGEIARQVAWFRDRGQAFEWKTDGRDGPPELGACLVAAGFVAGAPEAFVVGEVSDVVDATAGHDGVDGIEIRRARREDLPGMGDVSAAVWDDPALGMLAALFDERDHDPTALELLVAVQGETVLSHGWVQLPRCEFASLWGGTTHPDHRHRGIYRALVRRRALRMAAIDTTTPYRWRPSAADGCGV